jgi:hypothetical protein
MRNVRNIRLQKFLNKTVEFNQPNVVNYKGILHVYYNIFYIEITEVILGHLNVTDVIYLTLEQEQYVICPIELKNNNWFHRLLLFILKLKK